MTKLEYFIKMLDFLPELFPPDLAAITLSNTTHFIGVWSRPDDSLGNAIKKALYPGKELDDRVMLGQIVKNGTKITKYYTKDESVFGMPYLAVGIPIYDNNILQGGICTLREETILEAQNRCRLLINVHDILEESMTTVSKKMTDLLSSYNETRKINELMQEVNHKASLLQVNTLLKATNLDADEKANYLHLADEIKGMTNDTKQAALKIINTLNEFDLHASDFLSSIRHIEVIINNMNNSINSIMDYLAQQSNMIISNKK